MVLERPPPEATAKKLMQAHPSLGKFTVVDLLDLDLRARAAEGIVHVALSIGSMQGDWYYGS